MDRSVNRSATSGARNSSNLRPVTPHLDPYPGFHTTYMVVFSHQFARGSPDELN
jgi:hypothetical protein